MFYGRIRGPDLVTLPVFADLCGFSEGAGAFHVAAGIIAGSLGDTEGFGAPAPGASLSRATASAGAGSGGVHEAREDGYAGNRHGGYNAAFDK
jgi:hypothetical protein